MGGSLGDRSVYRGRLCGYLGMINERENVISKPVLGLCGS